MGEKETLSHLGGIAVRRYEYGQELSWLRCADGL